MKLEGNNQVVVYDGVITILEIARILLKMGASTFSLATEEQIKHYHEVQNRKM
jgi:hypothetical protein